MEVIIKNCNNIKEGHIDIVPNKLNIKYGINGTGKSTISKAIIKKINGESLDDLRPFNSDYTVVPSIIGCEEFKKVKIYNDDYVAQYLFLPNGDNLHRNSFEVFIKPDDYDEQINNINSILYNVKNYVIENSLINNLINQKNELNKILKLNSKKTSINSTGLGKALATGNKIVNIPEILTDYTLFLKSKEKINWYKWQNSGRKYILDGKCPFCAKNLDEKFDDYMEVLDTLFDQKNVELLTKMESIFESIFEITGESTNKFIANVITNDKPILDNDKEKIASIMVELDDVYSKMIFLSQLDYLSLKDINDLKTTLYSSIINVKEYLYICGEEFLNLVDELNRKIRETISSVELLQKNISILNSSIKAYTNKNKQRINDFLEIVGMNYEVAVKNEKLLLYYKKSEIVVDVNSHLSWGEKNAFALSLFLFDCLHENPDLIILDDPVSSFDFNKKYAITHYLFNQKNSLHNKTVLILTHDLEPIINMVKVKKFKFVNSFYLENINGIIKENPILECDINSILNVAKNNFQNTNLNIINRLVHFRRYLELNNEYAYEYNMVSSLLKGFVIPKYVVKRIERNFTDSEFEETQESIRNFINDFDYNEIHKNIKNKSFMKQLYFDTGNAYEKTEIFRIILKTFGLLNVNPVIEEFINEEFHIENTYIFQLDPYAYNIVPNYIVEICDATISKMKIDVPVTNQ